MNTDNQICETCAYSDEENSDSETNVYCLLWNIIVDKKSSCSDHTFKLVFDELPND